jgi:hypothetical protein
VVRKCSYDCFWAENKIHLASMQINQFILILQR